MYKSSLLLLFDVYERIISSTYEERFPGSLNFVNSLVNAYIFHKNILIAKKYVLIDNNKWKSLGNKTVIF